MKISKKKANLLRLVIDDSIQEILANDEFFDKEFLYSDSSNPKWTEEKERFNMLSELHYILEKNIFEKVFTEYKAKS